MKQLVRMLDFDVSKRRSLETPVRVSLLADPLLAELRETLRVAILTFLQLLYTLHGI